MWMLLLVAYGQRDPNAFFLTQHIRQSFSKDISDSMSIQDVFGWANTTLLSNLFGEYPGQIVMIFKKLLKNVIVDIGFTKPIQLFKASSVYICL